MLVLIEEETSCISGQFIHNIYFSVKWPSYDLDN